MPAAYDSDSDSGLDLDKEEDSATKCPAYKTQSVHFREKHSNRAQPKDEDKSMTLLTNLSNLSIHEPSYLMLYSKCQKWFQTLHRTLPNPTSGPHCHLQLQQWPSSHLLPQFTSHLPLQHTNHGNNMPPSSC